MSLITFEKQIDLLSSSLNFIEALNVVLSNVSVLTDCKLCVLVLSF